MDQSSKGQICLMPMTDCDVGTVLFLFTFMCTSCAILPDELPCVRVFAVSVISTTINTVNDCLVSMAAAADAGRMCSKGLTSQTFSDS